MVFQEPTSLPSVQTTDHQIILEQRAKPINIYPYHYLHYQKNEIEWHTLEMLQQGLIRPSANPFSSSILLVRKKDVTWRFCVDYHTLNTIIMCDRFSILTMDEIIDELHGAKNFTKLDLQSGYHQIWVVEEDITKPAFWMHHSHFVVISFRLTNALMTFLMAMNELFAEHLRKFIVFFSQWYLDL